MKYRILLLATFSDQRYNTNTLPMSPQPHNRVFVPTTAVMLVRTRAQLVSRMDRQDKYKTLHCCPGTAAPISLWYGFIFISSLGARHHAHFPPFLTADRIPGFLPTLLGLRARESERSIGETFSCGAAQSGLTQSLTSRLTATCTWVSHLSLTKLCVGYPRRHSVRVSHHERFPGPRVAGRSDRRTGR